MGSMRTYSGLSGSCVGFGDSLVGSLSTEMIPAQIQTGFDGSKKQFQKSRKGVAQIRDRN